VVENQEARARIGGVAGWFLTHNRDIYMRADDSVTRTFEVGSACFAGRAVTRRRPSTWAARCPNCWPAAGSLKTPSASPRGGMPY